jgi:hypothetical protein
MNENIVEPVAQHSYLMWYFYALGSRYAIALPLVGLVAAPVFVGMMGTVSGAMPSFQVITLTNAQPKPADLAMGMSMALISMQVGLLLAFPSFAIATIGLLIRTLSERGQEESPGLKMRSPRLN